MKTNDMTLILGGDAGQGIQSTGLGLCKALGRSGLFMFGREDYRSQIRGGHNFFEIRIKDEQIYTHLGEADLLIALTPDSIDHHLDDLVEGGGIIYDEDFGYDQDKLENRDIIPFPVPLTKIAKEEGGAKVMANTASIGVAAGLTNFDLDYIGEIIEENFKVKGDQVVKNNLQVAKAGYEYAQTLDTKFEYNLKPVKDAPRRMVLDGNQAFVLGAISSGCNFISAYPMTPSTSIFEGLSSYAKEYGIINKQTESELAAVCMAIGASFVGARSMCSTSGGGFSLMVEALGLAGMTETPIVIAEVQRPGPSTGLPTRTEQGDLLFVIYASQGEFPRIVLTPGTPEEYFRAGVEAFNLAEKYQTPVIVLADQHLANSVRVVDPGDIDMEGAAIDRGEFLTEEDLDTLEGEYKRHQFTDSGISPRAVPGHQKAVYKTTGNEHNEKGEITEDPVIRSKMVQKRLKKLKGARKEAIKPKLYGPENAEITFLGWGSSYGAIREAADSLNDNGKSANHYHFPQAWPLPEERVAQIIENAKNTVMIEGNATGQLAQLIRQRTGKQVDYMISKYDGRPLSPNYILENLENLEGVN